MTVPADVALKRVRRVGIGGPPGAYLDPTTIGRLRELAAGMEVSTAPKPHLNSTSLMWACAPPLLRPATSLFGAGTPPVLAAEIMGHKLETLLPTYAHAIPNAQSEKREALERLSAQLEATIEAR